jgi:branched-chain amino acid transport system substrate-binding protein
MKRRTLIGGAAAAAAVAAVGRPAWAAQGEFKIGVVASLSGGFASAGKDTIDGYNAWAKVKNAAGGLNGKKIVFEVLDDETNPVNAVNAFRRLAADPKVMMIWLALPSNSSLGIKAIASEFKVPVISGGAVDTLGYPADPWFFKIAPAARDFMVVLVDYAKKKGYKRIGSLNGSDAYGQTEIKHLRDVAKEGGLEIVAAETFGVEDTNFNAQLTKVRAAKPDLIYSGATGRTAILIYKQFTQLGIKTPLVMSQAAISKPFFDAIGGAEKADGVMYPTELGSFGPVVGGDSARQYAELEKTLGRTPLFFNSFGWDYGVIAEAAFKASNGTRQGLRDALDKIKDLPALNGPVTYTPTNHTGQNFRAIRMAKLVKGKIVPAD